MAKTLQKITAKATPQKQFFISMLTRDIRLTDCILDLVDNSLDSVVYNTNFDPMVNLLKVQKGSVNSLASYTISINFSAKDFTISDNAFGISKEDAQNKVFLFGSDKKKKGKKGGLSIYGIGMKRACYKIGNSINISSTTGKTFLTAAYDVAAWLKSDDWELEMTWRDKKATDKRGTVIKVTGLHDEIVSSFKQSTFEAEIINRISATYSLFIERGLTITVNGKKAVSSTPKLPESKEIQISRKTFRKDKVTTLILAGVNKDAETRSSGGWYIFCNGRLILEADKTEYTGWGNGLRRFHQAIYPFLGFVYFQSDELESLPWTTTKDNINFESPIYQYTLSKMKLVALPIVQLLTKRYSQKSFRNSYDAALDAAKNVALTDVSKKDRVFSLKIDKEHENEEIAYTVSAVELKQAKEALGKIRISNSDLGKATFKYFLDRESDK